MSTEEQDRLPTTGKHLAPPIDLDNHNRHNGKEGNEHENGLSSTRVSNSVGAKYDFEDESNPPSRTSLDASTFEYDIASPISGRSGRHVPSLTSSLSRVHGRRLSSASLTMSLANSSTVSGLVGTIDQAAYPNSISSLVDSPNSKFIVRPPTSRDIPLVTLSATPRIKLEEFEPYLSATSDDYRSIKSSKDTFSGAQSYAERNSSSTLPDIVSPDVLGTSMESVPDVKNSIEYPVSLIAPRSGLLSPSRPPSESSLNAIPSVFFENDFSLQNPRVFNLVTEKAELLSPSSLESLSEYHFGNRDNTTGGSRDNSKLLANNAIMQEKLSWYLDVVEVNLINEISRSSSSFFEALSSLKDLGNESTGIISRLQNTRNSLVNIGEKRAQAGLQLWELKRKRAYARRLSIAMKQVLLVMEYGDLAEKQLEQGLLSEAFHTLECCRLLIDGQLDQSPISGKTIPRNLQISLRSVRALDDLRENIAVLGNRIGKEYELRLTECLMSDLKTYIDSTSPRKTLIRLCKKYTLLDADKSVILRHCEEHQAIQSADYSVVSAELRKELSTQFDGVAQCKAVSGAEKHLRDSILREFKSIIRSNLPHDDNDDDTLSISSSQSGLSKTADLTRRLRTLSPDDNERMLLNIFTQLSEALRRLSTLQKVLLDISSRVQQSRSDKTRQDANSLADSEIKSLDLSSTISEAVAQSQDRITKIYNVRRDQNASLDFFYFMRFYTLSGLFISESEALTGLTGSNLQRTVISSVRQFLHLFHESSIKKTLSAIENDRWTDEYIRISDQSCADRIVQSATSDPVGWTSGFWECIDNTDCVTEEDEKSEKRTKVLIVGDDKFMVSTSGLTAIHFMETYLEVISSFRHVAADSAGDLVELLRLVNSRICQVILGAGATRSTELKSITAKHLALSSQTLALIITLIPYCRAFIQRRIANISSVLMEMDKVRRSYQQHQEEIYEKLVSIMRERLQNHIVNIRKVDFSGISETEEEAHPYMITLIRDLTKLAKICKRYLPEIAAEHVLRQIVQVYSESLLLEFQKILAKTISNTPSRQSSDIERLSDAEKNGDINDTQESSFSSMQRDVNYFCKSISELPGHENARDILKPILASNGSPAVDDAVAMPSSTAAENASSA